MDKKISSDMKAVSFKFDSKSTPDRIYLEEYSPRTNDPSRPLGRTLFVAKVPLYLDENDVGKLFSEVGPIVSVTLQKNKSDENNDEAFVKGSQCAFVIYKSRESLVKALNLDKLKTLKDENYSPLRGLQKYVKEYNDSICNHAVLLEEAKKAIKMQEKQEAKKSKRMNDEDEESCTSRISKRTTSRNPNCVGRIITKGNKNLDENLSKSSRNKTAGMEYSTV